MTMTTREKSKHKSSRSGAGGVRVAGASPASGSSRQSKHKQHTQQLHIQPQERYESNNDLEEAGVSLRTIDEAYGANVDLYQDVLGVKPNAMPEQIQRAYFDRRNELFQLLSEFETSSQTTGEASASIDSITASHRFHAERKMDAVVMSMRILGDPELRMQYDDLRHERLRRRDASDIEEDYEDIDVTAGVISNTMSNLETNYNLDIVDSNTDEYDPADVNTVSDTDGSDELMQTDKIRLVKNSKIVPSKHHQMMQVQKQQQKKLRSRDAEVLNGMRSRDGTYFPHSSVEAPPPTTRQDRGSSRHSSRSSARVVSPDNYHSTHASANKKSKSSSKKISVDPESRKVGFRESEAASFTNRTLDTTTDECTLSDGEDVDDLASIGTTLTTSKKSFVQRCKDEFFGAIEDTTNSLEQVMNAFTLQEEDIKAVRHRIDKAKRQMSKSL